MIAITTSTPRDPHPQAQRERPRTKRDREGGAAGAKALDARRTLTAWLVLTTAGIAGCSATPTPATAPPAPEPVAAPALEPVATFELVTTEPAPQAADLWARVRRGFALPATTHPRVAAHRARYRRHPHHLERIAARAQRYLHHIVEEVERRGLPTELALLPVVESGFDPYAYSHGRAAGLWQFIPATGRHYGLDQDWWHDERRDVVAATRAALDYLSELHRQFDGDWLLALAAYNSGQGNVRAALRRNRRRGAGEDFFALDLPRETEAYVPKLLALRDLVTDPGRYDLQLPPLDDGPYFAVVETGGQLDLMRAARLAQVEVEELYRLNPALNRWATHPRGPHRLLVPAERAEAFAAAVAELPPEDRLAWRRHRIAAGETLSGIALHHRTDVDTLRRANRLSGSRIRAGDTLLVPVAAAAPERYGPSATQRRQDRIERHGAGAESRYRVRRGDSLWTIARAHDLSVRELATRNGMAPGDLLHPGRTLVLGDAGDAGETETEAMPAPPEAMPAPVAAPPADAVVRRVGYRVRAGDSLARIATRFGVSIAQIVDWNRLDPARYLQPGQRLTLFVDVTAGR